MPGWNKGAETQRHEEGECEMRNMHQPHASSLHNTHKQTILLFHSNEGIITAHKCTQTTCQSARSECPKTRPMSGAQKKNNSAREKRVPCSAFRCARPWKEKANTEEKRTEREGENRGTPILQLYCHYACFAWWQTMTITLKAKLSQEHLKAFSCERQIIAEQQHMQILSCLLWNSHYQWQNILVWLASSECINFHD